MTLNDPGEKGGKPPKPKNDPFDPFCWDMDDDGQARSLIQNYCSTHNIGLTELWQLIHLPKGHFLFTNRVKDQVARMLKEPTVSDGEVH